jgi:hypothetical protein
MTHILFEPVRSRPTVLFRTEHVERKGLGHPDTICDSIMEAASNLLCRHYLEACGRVLHHNVDKGLLVAGESSPRLAGGEVNVPLRLIFGDRATDEVNGKKIPAERHVLPEGTGNHAATTLPGGLLQGCNSWLAGNATGYRGPLPPRDHGVHRYHFHLFALDRDLDLHAGATKAELLVAINGHVLEETELIGTYQR